MPEMPGRVAAPASPSLKSSSTLPIAEPPRRSDASRRLPRGWSEQQIVSDPASQPAWIDQTPGLEHAVYRLPVKSGLYSTQEECRQALAVAVAQAVAQYGKTYLADVDSHGPVRSCTICRPILAAKRHRGDRCMRKPSRRRSDRCSSCTPCWNSATTPAPNCARPGGRRLIPRRVRWAPVRLRRGAGVVGVLLAALRLDLASGGKHRGRLRWATALMILLVVGSAWGLCLL